MALLLLLPSWIHCSLYGLLLSIWGGTKYNSSVLIGHLLKTVRPLRNGGSFKTSVSIEGFTAIPSKILPEDGASST